VKAASTNRAQRRRNERRANPRVPWKQVAATGVTVVFLAIIGLVVILNRQSSATPAFANPSPLSVGQRAAPFSVTTINGRSIDSTATSGPIMLEIFATWCPHCQRETAALESLHKRLANSLTMVGVTGSGLGADHNSPESVQDVRAFVRYFRVTYDVAFDPNLDVANHYFQGGFPTIIFINSQKRISAIEEGEVPLARLESDARKVGIATVAATQSKS
jgi:thiol-disulfide isomerase/thioredoxin